MHNEARERYELMRAVRDEVLALTSSPLYRYRTEHHYLPVIGEGSHQARIMLVGEAPGRNEAQTGRPFCGAAGRVLDELLTAAAIPRNEVYITNILKDRPPENRDPLPEEITVYAPFLERQIAIIKPAVIASLGRYAMGYLFKSFGKELELLPISRMHGKTVEAVAPYGAITLVALYHPAVAVYNSAMKEALMEDFKILTHYHGN